MTFATWERWVRLFSPYEMIWTELGYGGEVVFAWTSHGRQWPKKRTFEVK